MNRLARLSNLQWTVFTVLISALLGLSCLPFSSSLFADDWVHAAVLDGTLSQAQGFVQSGPWDLFRFYSGDVTLNQQALDSSISLWFTHPELKLGFWRPISSLLFTFDHELFGIEVKGYLLHSILWYAALCAIVATLYLRIFPGPVGKMSSILFAILGTHHQSVVWSSGRNSLLCACFGGLALLIHLKRREDRLRAGGGWVLGLMVLALLSGEAALGMVGFILAYELLGREESIKLRIKEVLPLLLVVVCWLTIYVLLDYGTHRSGEYINPLNEPFEYLVAVPARMGNALSVLLAGAPADLWFLAPAARTGIALLGIFSLVIMGAWTWAVARAAAPELRRHLSWLSLGMILAILPQLAGVLGPRSFLIPSLGSAAIVSVLVISAFQQQKWGARAGAVLLVVLHGLFGIGMWIGTSSLYAKISEVAATNYKKMGLDAATAAERSYVLVSTSEVFSSIYAPAQFAARQRTRVGGWRVLSLCECDHTLTQLSERKFEVALAGNILNSPFAALLRSSRYPLKRGERVDLPDIAIEVLDSGEPGQHSRFLVELKGAKLPEFWAWSDGKMEHFALPKPGQSRTFKWIRPGVE